MKPLNPYLPLQYQNESDYRNIPRHHLTQHIPQGRGMIKWAPFATMPQQYEDIARLMANQNKLSKPELSEDQQIELDIMLAACMNRISSITIQYYENGYVNDYECIVDKIDYIHKKVEVYLCFSKERKTLDVGCIVSMYE